MRDEEGREDEDYTAWKIKNSKIFKE